MPQFIPVGLAAGIATALLFASASAGGMAGRVILFFLAPLPCYLAGLGWGAVAGALGAVTSAIAMGAFINPRTGAVFLVSQGIPLVALCYLALLSRPVGTTGEAPQAGAPPLEWYPVGRLIAAATLMAGALSFLSLLMLGADIEGLRTMMREMVDRVLAGQLPGLGGETLSDADKAQIANMMLAALPAGAAIVWLGGFLINLSLAGSITRVSGRLARPWPDLTLMRFPRGFAFGLAAAVGLSLLPDLPGLLATGFVGAFLLAYLLMGLAIIHYATRNMAGRVFILTGVYVALLLFNTWAAIVVALIAILEPMLWYRRPDLPEDGGPQPPPPPPAT